MLNTHNAENCFGVNDCGICWRLYFVLLVTECCAYALNRTLADDIILNAHARTEYESDDAIYGFCGELERVFDKFPKYRMKMLLRDFNANVGRKGMFTLANLNESLCETRMMAGLK